MYALGSEWSLAERCVFGTFAFPVRRAVSVAVGISRYVVVIHGALPRGQCSGLVGLSGASFAFPVRRVLLTSRGAFIIVRVLCCCVEGGCGWRRRDGGEVLFWVLMYRPFVTPSCGVHVLKILNACMS